MYTCHATLVRGVRLDLPPSLLLCQEPIVLAQLAHRAFVLLFVLGLEFRSLVTLAVGIMPLPVRVALVELGCVRGNRDWLVRLQSQWPPFGLGEF